MRILKESKIKHSKPEREQKTRCPYCGCVIGYYPSERDYMPDDDDGAGYDGIDCPNCNRFIVT